MFAQVLDGEGITDSMKEAADELYRGRLYAQDLADIVKHNNFNGLRELDLSDQNLRYVQDVLQPELFLMLTSLRLDGNGIEEVQTPFLAKLRYKLS